MVMSGQDIGLFVVMTIFWTVAIIMYNFGGKRM